jgi:hypothetical protein
MAVGRTPRARARLGWGCATLALLLVAGCFGDWVRAKPYPRREDLPPVKPAPKEDRGPDRPCVAYRAQIAEVCEGLLQGRIERVHCYTEVLKLSAKPAIDNEFADPSDGLTQRQRSCRGDWLGLTQRRADSEPRPAVDLGPQCLAWAQQLRRRCITPLAEVDVALPTECGTWMMTMQTAVRGRADKREDACARSLANLEPDDATGDGSGDGATGDASTAAP